MKIRINFVPNSSSCSFVIKKKNLCSCQIEKIHNHLEVGKELGLFKDTEKYNTAHLMFEWDIKETEDEIRGETTMDNFDMVDFLKITLLYKKS